MIYFNYSKSNNIRAETGNAVGSLVGCVVRGIVSECQVAGGTVQGRADVGGLVGRNAGGVLDRCVASVSVIGDTSVGGLLGWNGDAGVINECVSTSRVYATECSGGLVGENTGTVSNAYCTGILTATRSPNGGLVGRNHASGIVQHSYSICDMSATESAGGLIGMNEGGAFTDSFWDVQASKVTYSDGGAGKATQEMWDSGVFSQAGWDIDGTWKFPACAGPGYPRLSWEKYGRGRGTIQEPYLLCSAGQLRALGASPCDWDKHFTLTADIDLTGAEGEDLRVIGDAGCRPFTGVFDGNGHRILNLHHSSTAHDYIGLFGVVEGVGAEVKNVGMVDPTIIAGGVTCVGAIVGRLGEGAFLSRCSVNGGSIEGARAGGLVGEVDGGNVTDCYSTGSVTGQSYVGGLVGSNDGNGSITMCHSSAPVNGGDYVGGLVGRNYWGDSITNCNSSGTVSGQSYVGGLAGYNYGNGSITTCHSSASVNGGDYVGGLVGYNSWGASVTNCYSSGTVSGQSSVGGLVGCQAYGTITNCYSTASVTGYQNVGSLVGRNYRGGSITNCYSTGTVSGWWYHVGGLVGYNGEHCSITNCYSTGLVTGQSSVGGLVGSNAWRGSITSSFWDIQTSEQKTSSRGTGLNTAEMQTASPFLKAGWDFMGETDNGTKDIWWIDEGKGYPKLSWELVGDRSAEPDS